MQNKIKAFISDWDTNHFGFKVAKANVASVEEVLPTLDFCNGESIKLLISRVPSDNTSLIHELQRCGFLLMDGLIKYRLDLANANTNTTLDLSIIRSYKDGDAESITNIALRAFRGYIDHFHKDPKLDTTKCDLLYAQWGYNSCFDKSLAEKVLVAEVEKKVIGFAGIILTEPRVGDFGLVGVSPKAKGRGIYRKLYLASIDWCRSQGLNYLETKTQFGNYAVQKVWGDLGFRVCSFFYTFHKWLK